MEEPELTSIDTEDFILRIRPETDTDGEWTGEIDVAIITQPDNDLNDEDYSQIMHFCKMLASTIPVMEFRELVHKYVMAMKGLEYDVELEDKPKVIGEDGNVIQIDFNTKTEGSA